MIAARETLLPGGGTATYREAGHGAPVILIAGLGLSSRFYERSYGPFANAGLRLIVPDLPGFGGTPGPATGFSMTDAVAFLARFADALDVSHAAWIGHSIGWQIAVELAARHPHRARALVLAGISNRLGGHTMLKQAAGLAVAAAREPFGLLRAVARDYVHTSPLRYFGTWARAAQHDALARAALVQCPALILVGTNDPLPSREYIALLRARIGSACVEWVPGGGHGLPRDSTRAFNRAAARFIRRCHWRPPTPQS